MPYECDLDMVWNLPAGDGCFYNPVNGKYCAVGKLLSACNVIVSYSPSGRISAIDQKFYDSLERILDGNPSGWGFNNNDLPMGLAHTSQERQQAHENACRKLLELCLADGLITLKESDLAIVRELKARELVS